MPSISDNMESVAHTHSENALSSGDRVIEINDTKPHPKLWFQDGSIVIQASSIRYRVHLSILCNQSTVFKDMMALPQPGDSSGEADTFEGCPIVRVPDSSEDLSELLQALYDPEYFSEIAHSMDPRVIPEGLVRTLCMSTKYDFTVLRRRAIRALEKHIPTDLDGFAALCSSFTIAGEDSKVIEEMTQVARILEASSCQLQRFLPATLYRLSCLLAPDGSQDHLLIASPLIAPENKMWCFSGRTRVKNLKIPCRATSNPCRITYGSKSKNCKGAPQNIPGKFPFSKIQWPLSTPGYCHQCTLQEEQSYYKEQQKAWNLLPEYFGCPGQTWSELNGVAQ